MRTSEPTLDTPIEEGFVLWFVAPELGELVVFAADDDAVRPELDAAPGTTEISAAAPPSASTRAGAPSIALESVVVAPATSAVETAPPVSEAAAAMSAQPAPAETLAGRAVAGGAFATLTSAPFVDYDGTGTAIVVIDDGWSPYYDQSNLRWAFDFSGANDPYARQYTYHSHGSWVASVATGVADDVDIIHLKVVADGAGGASLRDIEEALQWTLRTTDVFNTVAVNMSLGYGNATAEVRTSFSDEIAALAAKDVVSVVAAGNAGATYADGVSVLAADPNAVAVSAVDGADRFTSWTQKSAELTDIAALGAGVRVDTIDGSAFRVSGTSFAAPYVASTTAALQEAALDLIDRRLGVEEIVAILQASGDDVRGSDVAADGYRVADAEAAVDWLVAHAEDHARLDDLVA